MPSENGDLVATTITIRRRQKDELERRHLNVSSLIRELLDEYLEEDHGRRDDETDQKATAAVSA